MSGETQAALSAEQVVVSVATTLRLTDALTPNDDGTPTHYIVDAENVEYLVYVVLRLAAGREAQAGIEAAADVMEAVIADGDVAEVAAHVPGEVGRSTCIERRDSLYEDPVAWLRAYAVIEGAARSTLPGQTP